MLLNDQELAALADHLIEVVECDPEYEDDAFAITFYGVRIYCERYRTFYRAEIGHQDDVVELPRITVR
jgi:hypothetical protein